MVRPGWVPLAQVPSLLAAGPLEAPSLPVEVQAVVPSLQAERLPVEVPSLLAAAPLVEAPSLPVEVPSRRAGPVAADRERRLLVRPSRLRPLGW